MPLPLQHVIHLSSLIIQIFTVAPASFASGNVVYVSSGADFTAYAFDLSSQAFSVRCSICRLCNEHVDLPLPQSQKLIIGKSSEPEASTHCNRAGHPKSFCDCLKRWITFRRTSSRNGKQATQRIRRWLATPSTRNPTICSLSY